MTARQEIFFAISSDWDLDRVITAFKIGGMIPEPPTNFKKVKMTITVEDVLPLPPVVVIVPVPILVHADTYESALKKRIEATKDALRESGGDIGAAARVLGLTYRGMRARMQTLRIYNGGH